MRSTRGLVTLFSLALCLGATTLLADEGARLAMKCGEFDNSTLESALQNPSASDSDSFVRACAIWRGVILQLPGYQESVKRSLPAALTTGDTIEKVAALKYISSKGAIDSVKFALIEKALKDPSPEVRLSATNVLGRLNQPIAPEAEQLLFADLHSYVSQRQTIPAISIAVVIVNVGSQSAAEEAAKEYVKIIAEIAQASQKQVAEPKYPEPSFGAINQIFRVTTEERRKLLQAAIPHLLALLNSNISPQTRANTIVDLGNLASSSKEVLDALCTQFNSDHNFAQSAASTALSRLGQSVKYCGSQQTAGVKKLTLQEEISMAQFKALDPYFTKDAPCDLTHTLGKVDTEASPQDVAIEYSSNRLLRIKFACQADRSSNIHWFCTKCSDSTSHGVPANGKGEHIIRNAEPGDYRISLTCSPRGISAYQCGKEVRVVVPSQP